MLYYYYYFIFVTQIIFYICYEFRNERNFPETPYLAILKLECYFGRIVIRQPRWHYSDLYPAVPFQPIGLNHGSYFEGIVRGEHPQIIPSPSGPRSQCFSTVNWLVD